MAESRGAQLLELALEAGGGAAAGALDVETFGKTVGGVPYGTVAGAVLSLGAVALGPKALGGMAGYLGDLGGGMLAYEAGATAANWRANVALGTRQQGTPATGVQGVFRRRRSAITAGTPRVISQNDLHRSFAELEQLQRVG